MKKIIITIVIFAFLFLGCQRGDIVLSPVFEGQPAPHAGYNIGPELWVEQGIQAKVSGAVIWIRGTDPNSLFGP